MNAAILYQVSDVDSQNDIQKMILMGQTGDDCVCVYITEKNKEKNRKHLNVILKEQIESLTCFI